MRFVHSRPLPRPRLLTWTALVSWCALIFALSAQPDLTISDHDLLDLVLRKLAHATVFGILAVLASMTLRQEGIAANRALLGGMTFSLLYAVSDEWHQTFVQGRMGTPRDVAIDAVGIVIAGLLLRRRT